MTRTRSPHRVRAEVSHIKPVVARPDPSPSRWWNSSTLWCGALFTAVQVWALINVLLWFRPDGVARVALVCVMAAAVTAVLSAWERPRSASPHRNE
jgi:hypothetical protein